MHEIITLQLGRHSNHLATHFWNAQEAYFTYESEDESAVDHDVHWRAGIANDGSETFLPRTVIYDLKSSFGSLRRVNALYEDTPGDDSHAWNGRAVVHAQPSLTTNPYQQSLEQGLIPPPLTIDNVQFWSDYNRVFYHPRSIVQIPDHETNTSVMPFDVWARGRDLFESLDKEHGLLDRDIRPFLEESDSIQGFQLFSAIDDAWGGFAASYTERLRDEYGKPSIWTWGISTPLVNTNKKQRVQRAKNLAESLTSMHDDASMIVPLQPPKSLPSYVEMDKTSLWHTSALLATGVETSLLPCRLRTVSGLSANTLDSMVNVLCHTGHRTIASLEMTIEKTTGNDRKLPYGANENDHGIPLDPLPVLEIYLSQFHGAHGQIRQHDATVRSSQVSVYRLPRSSGAIRRQGISYGTDHHLPGQSTTRRYECHVDFPLPDSFPPIYHLSGGEDAEILAQISMCTRLSSGKSLSRDFKGLRSFLSPSLSTAERESLVNGLAELQDAYREGSSSDTEEYDE